ncbi:hypothetical protein TcCL_NonESM00598 [Trypanosoma cruzi]|nr:hypothetical protein TcCL_NonESM00598 [Trypanosoma cruzi]
MDSRRFEDLFSAPIRREEWGVASLHFCILTPRHVVVRSEKRGGRGKQVAGGCMDGRQWTPSCSGRPACCTVMSTQYASLGFHWRNWGMRCLVCLCRRTVTAPTASAYSPQWSGYRRRETASVLNAVPGYACSAVRAEPKCIPKTETDLYQSLSFFDAFNDSAEQLWSRKLRAKVNRTDGDRSRDCFPDDGNRLSSHGASVLHQTAALDVFRDSFISAGWQEDRPDEFFDNVCREEIRETPLEEKSCATSRF